MSKCLVLVNPVAGRRVHSGEFFDGIKSLSKRFDVVAVHMSTRKGEMVILARDNAPLYDTFVVLGGDGTLNEVVNGCHLAMTYPDIKYVPAGTCNDFGSSHGYSKHMLVEVSKQFIASTFDAGMFNQSRLFTYVAGFGAFAASSYATSSFEKARFGKLAYVKSIIGELFHLHPIRLQCLTEIDEFEGEFLCGMVTNSRFVGGNEFFCDMRPEDYADGLFELTLFKFTRNPFKLIRMFFDLKAGRTNSNIIRRKVKTVHIRTYSKQGWSLDGECVGRFDEVHITVKHGIVHMVK